MASAGEEQWGNVEPHTVGPNLETSETSQWRAKASSCILMRCSPAMHAASATEIKLLFWRNKEHGWIELELVPLKMEKSGNSSKVAARWLDSSVAKGVVTCKWLRAGAGTSRLTWPLQHKSGSAPRRTSWSAESETSGRPRWRTPSRRTSGPVEEARAAVGSAWEDHSLTFWVSDKTTFSFPDDSKILNFYRSNA